MATKLKYSQTQSIPEFKQRFGIATLEPQQVTSSGKMFFITNVGITGKVSSRSHQTILDRDLPNLRISWCTEVDDQGVPTGREFWQLHNTQSEGTVSESIGVQF